MIHKDNELRNMSKLEERIVFFFVCIGIISITYGVLFVLDFLPEKKVLDTDTVALMDEQLENLESNEVTALDEESVPVEALPISIIIDSLDKKVTILNPDTDSISALDEALLSGVVRHPDSADFNEKGTIFLLGHSSYLPVVNNKNFQAFNGIQKLKWGDTIRLRSSDTEYVYSVARVYEAKATDAEVKIERGVSSLILSTCNSFGTKDDRFIVEAMFVESHSF
ncbi:MAG: sortase [Candidatus Pacebacteria bacterium]|nr:sortase [Candidatus Paceibacterota bacterium]MCF7856996.1 sortase [Candidatus Paceibacterota bacterium]